MDGRLSSIRKWTTCPRSRSGSRSLTCHGNPDLVGFIIHIIRPIEHKGILFLCQIDKTSNNAAYILRVRVDRLTGFQICPYLHSTLSISKIIFGAIVSKRIMILPSPGEPDKSILAER